MGRRGAGRVSRESQSLAAYDHALDEVNRKNRDLKTDPPRVEHMVMANEVRKLYGEREGFSQFDNNEDGFIPDDDGTAPDAALITEG